jgi:protein phosphatase
MLAQALGPQPKVTPHVNITRIKENDMLLLCSDGLTSVVPDAEIKDVLGNSDDAARELVSLVYKQRGDDNVSIIVGRVRASSGILE